MFDLNLFLIRRLVFSFSAVIQASKTALHAPSYITISIWGRSITTWTRQGIGTLEFRIHTVSFEVFRSLSEYKFATSYFDEETCETAMHTYLFAKIFVKSLRPFTRLCHLTFFFVFHANFMNLCTYTC